jgi:hypothetical protein
MTAISPRRDDIGEAIGADGHLSRQGKNYEHNYKTKRPCKAYMSLRHKVLPSDAQIPPVVNRVVRAGVDRDGSMGVGIGRVRSHTGRYRVLRGRREKTG